MLNGVTAQSGVGFHDFKLGRFKPSRLEQNTVGYAHFADVMQGCRLEQHVDIVVREFRQIPFCSLATAQSFVIGLRALRRRAPAPIPAAGVGPKLAAGVCAGCGLQAACGVAYLTA